MPGVRSQGFDPTESWVSIPTKGRGADGVDPTESWGSIPTKGCGAYGRGVSACGVGVIMYGSQLCDPGSNPGWRIVLHRSLDGRVV